MKAIYTLLFFSMFFISCKGQNTSLSLQLEQGKTYEQTILSKATVHQEINGQDIDMEMNVNGKISYFIKEVRQDGYEMNATFDSLSLSMHMPQGSITFSSEKEDENDIFSTLLRAMLGKPFEVEMSKTGKVLKVNGIEALYDTVIQQFEIIPQFEQISPMQKEQIKAQIMNAYGEKALTGSIEMVTAIYPDHPVSKGDKWTIQTQLESGMAADMITQYEFAESTSEYTLIKGDAVIKTEDKDAYIESNGIPTRYDLTGKMTSEIKVDKNTGWIIEANIHQKVSGEAFIKSNPQMPEGLKVPMTMINKTEIKG